MLPKLAKTVNYRCKKFFSSGLGNKVAPFHVYVPHGSIGITGFPVDLSFASIKSWFTNDDNRVEGIVWQCTNGKLFKVSLLDFLTKSHTC